MTGKQESWMLYYVTFVFLFLFNLREVSCSTSADPRCPQTLALQYIDKPDRCVAMFSVNFNKTYGLKTHRLICKSQAATENRTLDLISFNDERTVEFVADNLLLFMNTFSVPWSDGVYKISGRDPDKDNEFTSKCFHLQDKRLTLKHTCSEDVRMTHFIVCQTVGMNRCLKDNGDCGDTMECEYLGPFDVKCKRCLDGFEVNENKTCTDTDECTNENGGCDQTCVNYGGGFKCVCDEEGYLKGEVAADEPCKPTVKASAGSGDDDDARYNYTIEKIATGLLSFLVVALVLAVTYQTWRKKRGTAAQVETGDGGDVEQQTNTKDGDEKDEEEKEEEKADG